MDSRSRVAFLRPSVSFLFPSYCLREAKMPDATDDHTKLRRRWIWWPDWIRYTHDGLTKGKMDTRKWTFAWSWAIFRHAKDFGSIHEVPAETEKLIRWSYDGIRWHKMPSRLALFAIWSEFEHFRYRVSIWCPFRDTVTSLDIYYCIILM